MSQCPREPVRSLRGRPAKRKGGERNQADARDGPIRPNQTKGNEWNKGTRGGGKAQEGGRLLFITAVSSCRSTRPERAREPIHH